MDGHFYALLARMRYIQRWALMRNTEPENIQEHSHMVAILAHALALIQNKHFGGHIDPGQAALLALYHDATEILTGDLPTPIKYYNPALRASYKEVEETAANRLLELLPEELRADYAPYLLHPDPELEAVSARRATVSSRPLRRRSGTPFRPIPCLRWGILSSIICPALN